MLVSSEALFLAELLVKIVQRDPVITGVVQVNATFGLVRLTDGDELFKYANPSLKPVNFAHP